jgi:hypothetical protein
MFCILNILFYHPVSEATPDSKITGSPRAAATHPTYEGYVAHISRTGTFAGHSAWLGCWPLQSVGRIVLIAVPARFLYTWLEVVAVSPGAAATHPAYKGHIAHISRTGTLIRGCSCIPRSHRHAPRLQRTRSAHLPYRHAG